ncbi:hypothetical protein IMZ48_41885 [Candidatus Bathyarchaeota archaeon]|nr:hypothetical protein [Candidatus Bathyarchaeota archaeon]
MFRPDIAHSRLATQIGECSWNKTMLNIGGTAPFQIDASIGAPAAMAESLLQSHESVLAPEGNGTVLRAAYTGDEGKFPLIRLLPSLPEDWASRGGGFAKGLRARGGFTVDLGWDSDGALTAASLTSEVGSAAYVTVGRAQVGSATEGSPLLVDGDLASGAFIILDGKKGSVHNITLA